MTQKFGQILEHFLQIFFSKLFEFTVKVVVCPATSLYQVTIGGFIEEIVSQI